MMTSTQGDPQFLRCNRCGRVVSTGFYPVPTDTPDRGLIVRAWIECPECIERHAPAAHPPDVDVPQGGA